MFKRLVVALIISAGLVGVVSANTETTSVLFSSLEFIFNPGYVNEKASELYGGSHILGLQSEFPGVVVVSSDGAAFLTMFEKVPSQNRDEVFEEMFCLVASTVVLAYGEHEPFELRLVQASIVDDEWLTFTTYASKMVAEALSCRSH